MSALPTPSSIFDLAGKSALVTGATGAFGAEAARAFAGAGAHVTLAGGSPTSSRRSPTTSVDGGGAASTVNLRPSTENDVDAIVGSGGRGRRWTRHRRVGLGDEHRRTDRRPIARRLGHGDGRQRPAVVAAVPICGPSADRAGPRRQGDPDVVGPLDARHGELLRVLPVEGRHRLAEQGRSRASGGRTTSRSTRSPRRCSGPI